MFESDPARTISTVDRKYGARCVRRLARGKEEHRMTDFRRAREAMHRLHMLVKARGFLWIGLLQEEGLHHSGVGRAGDEAVGSYAARGKVDRDTAR